MGALPSLSRPLSCSQQLVAVPGQPLLALLGSTVVLNLWLTSELIVVLKKNPKPKSSRQCLTIKDSDLLDLEWSPGRYFFFFLKVFQVILMQSQGRGKKNAGVGTPGFESSPLFPCPGAMPLTFSKPQFSSSV